MTKKPTTERKTNKTTRLGHDPFEDIGISETEDEISKSQDIGSDEKHPEISVGHEQDVLCLPSRFSIAAVEDVYKQMSSLLSLEQTCIELEAGEIESIDTSAIQLLYAFSAQAKISGKNLRWKSRSKIIDEASRTLNINILTDTD